MIALPKAQAKAVKLFCSDKDRPILHARYKVENSIAACTNGHIAAYWPTAEANGVYSLEGEGLQAEMPSCLAVLPAREQSIPVRQRVRLPQLKANKKGLVGIALCKRENTLYWVALAPDGYPDPVIAAFNADYLSAVIALCGDTPWVEITDSLSPALFFTDEPTAEYKDNQAPFAVVMPMRV